MKMVCMAYQMLTLYMNVPGDLSVEHHSKDDPMTHRTHIISITMFAERLNIAIISFIYALHF